MFSKRQSRASLRNFSIRSSIQNEKIQDKRAIMKTKFNQKNSRISDINSFIPQQKSNKMWQQVFLTSYRVHSPV